MDNCSCQVHWPCTLVDHTPPDVWPEAPKAWQQQLRHTFGHQGWVASNTRVGAWGPVRSLDTIRPHCGHLQKKAFSRRSTDTPFVDDKQRLASVLSFKQVDETHGGGLDLRPALDRAVQTRSRQESRKRHTATLAPLFPEARCGEWRLFSCSVWPHGNVHLMVP